MRLPFAPVLAAVAVLLLSACSGSAPEPASSPTPSPLPLRPLTVEMKVVETPAPPPVETPPPEVFVDAGHGTLDSGATNGAVGLLEKDVNVDIATRLAPLLGASGFNVYLSRWGDYTLSPFPENTYENRRDEIQARVDVANSVHADILVSIHI